LKLNTFIATLQLVNEICNVAISMSDEGLQKLSWSEFAANIKDIELIQYLKERNLYINEMVEETEEY
ncbi:MAG: zinc-binding protein, partial [Ruminococcus sp.]|nr:zinc-binding protein [Ruminococcus sp.]